MASEKTISISIAVRKNGLVAADACTLVEDLTGTDYIAMPLTVATSWTQISTGALASFDYLFLKNTDATNYIDVGNDDTEDGIFARLTPGRAMIIPAKSDKNYFARAHTAACVVNVVGVEP